MDIQDAEGETVATIKKALITPLRDRWKVEVINGPEMNVQSNILNHEYRIEAGRKKVAEISKKWFRIGEVLVAQDLLVEVGALTCSANGH